MLPYISVGFLLATRIQLRPKGVSSWQSSRRELVSPKEVKCEGEGENLIGGYFRAGLPSR